MAYISVVQSFFGWTNELICLWVIAKVLCSKLVFVDDLGIAVMMCILIEGVPFFSLYRGGCTFLFGQIRCCVQGQWQRSNPSLKYPVDLLAARCYTLFNECEAPFYPDVIRFALFTQKRSRVAGTEDEGKRAAAKTYH
jgi:hypothetical protein